MTDLQGRRTPAAEAIVSAVDNKQLMQEIFAGLSKGDGKLFRDSLAEDVRWTLMGTTKWSGTYEGKRAVIDNCCARCLHSSRTSTATRRTALSRKGTTWSSSAAAASRPRRVSPITTAIAGCAALPAASCRN
jgi:hypothetical protein